MKPGDIVLTPLPQADGTVKPRPAMPGDHDANAQRQPESRPMSTSISAPEPWVRSVGDLRLPPQADGRLQELMDRNNEGLLDEAGRAELAALAEWSETVSLLRAEALQLLGRTPA